VVRAFGHEADFSGITEAGPLWIGTVAHQAYIDVDEHGTEAAAATATVMLGRAAVQAPPPVTVIVDRPFLFAILDNATGLPVFLGQVSRPRSGKERPDPSPGSRPIIVPAARALAAPLADGIRRLAAATGTSR
jgi:serine protease inhibitor